MEFKITVSKRIAQTTSTESLICGNDGDTLTVTFDDEWTNISAKTARLVWIKGGEYTYIDVPFTGTSCPLPAVIQAKMLFVGFFAGDSTENTLKASTLAQILCISSILDVPAEAFTPDVYQNILDIIANKVDKVTGKGLSTNDYTDSAKSLLEETVPQELDRIDAKITEVEGNVYSNFKNKVDKVAGKGLSTNDYTDAEKIEVAKVSALPYATLSLEDYDTRKRGYIAADGEYTASGSWFSYYFYIDKYPIKKINAKLYSNSTAAYSIAFYSAKDSIASNLISGIKPTAAGANLISFDNVSVPENAALIVISTRFASGASSAAELFVNLNIPAAEMSNIGETSEKTGQIKRIFTDFTNANDFTFVKGELWGSGASGDTTVIKRYRITDDGLCLLGIIKTDFGHLNCFDYNPANDCLIFGNGSNDF